MDTTSITIYRIFRIHGNATSNKNFENSHFLFGIYESIMIYNKFLFNYYYRSFRNSVTKYRLFKTGVMLYRSAAFQFKLMGFIEKIRTIVMLSKINLINTVIIFFVFIYISTIGPLRRLLLEK